MQTFLTNARVVDGSGAPALEDATLVINGSVIEYVGASANAPQPGPDARVVDLGGKSVVPGLFNAHVHLALRLPFTERRIDQFTVGYRTMLIYRRALEAITTGTTTIRCVGEAHFADIDVRNAINKGVVAGPRILSAGAAMIPTGGHGHNSMSCREADGVAGFRQLAREQLRAGPHDVFVVRDAQHVRAAERIAASGRADRRCLGMGAGGRIDRLVVIGRCDTETEESRGADRGECRAECEQSSHVALPPTRLYCLRTIPRLTEDLSRPT